jgi:hypothetical protein
MREPFSRRALSAGLPLFASLRRAGAAPPDLGLDVDFAQLTRRFPYTTG